MFNMKSNSIIWIILSQYFKWCVSLEYLGIRIMNQSINIGVKFIGSVLCCWFVESKKIEPSWNMFQFKHTFPGLWNGLRIIKVYGMNILGFSRFLVVFPRFTDEGLWPCQGTRWHIAQDPTIEGTRGREFAFRRVNTWRFIPWLASG